MDTEKELVKLNQNKMKKQSSIEQLFDEIFKIPFNTPEAEDLYCEIMDLKEKYKEMHKQDMIDFSRECLNKAKDTDILTSFMNVEHHYKNTYEKE